MVRGKFIVLEGIDGCGKSTHTKLLAEYLRSRGVDAVCTREPTDGPFGATLRKCLTGGMSVDEKTIAALFLTDRLDHVFNERYGLLRRIEGGETVVSDRYYFSSYAYHGVHADADWVVAANKPCADALRPDLNIFIDVTPAESARRLNARGALQRYESAETMEKVRAAYFAAFDKLKNAEKIAVVKSGETVEKTAAEIRALADKLFGF